MSGKPLVYISGDRTTDPDCKEKFAKVEEYAESKGFDTYNPASYMGEKGWLWSDHMCFHIPALCECDGLAQVPNLGFVPARETQIEVQLAEDLGKFILPVPWDVLNR